MFELAFGVSVSVFPSRVLPVGSEKARTAPSVLAEMATFGLIGVAAALGFVLASSLMVGFLPAAPPWIVSAVCYAFFILPVYLLHRRFSFRSVAPHRHALPRYVATQLSALVLASVFSFVAYETLAVPTSWAALIVVGFTSAVNFVILRAWAFAVA